MTMANHNSMTKPPTHTANPEGSDRPKQPDADHPIVHRATIHSVAFGAAGTQFDR